MKVLITGGAGFLGSRLARTLLHHGQLSGQALTQLVLADLVPPAADLAADPRVRAWTGALLATLINQPDALRNEDFDVVFHLASTRALLDALRGAGAPRLVFSSSVAVFGGDVDLPMPRIIHDDTLPVPQTSYGIQKFVCEQLVADYTRRGLIDGRSARLMTVTVRPGRPNAAASGFLSSIVREPLNGQETVCPVAPDTLVAVASPQRAIEGLIKAAEATPDAWGSRTAVNLPGITVRVSEMLDALEIAGGRVARDRVHFEEDPKIARMMLGWPSAFESARARRLGLSADPDFLSIIRQFQKEQAV
jgi:nucleoside-diphosphate-sugar epimerase